MIRPRHILHPICSAKSLYRRASICVYRRLAERRFRNIRRGQRDRCWCGGQLLPFKWHPSYGVCAECGCYVNTRPPLRDEFKKIYSKECYWGIVSRLRGWPTLQHRGALYRADGRLDHWLGLIERYGPPQGSVIEIGCAPGVLLAELQRRGYRCIGVEAETKVAQWMRSNVNLDVRVAIFPDPELSLPNCDLFLAFDVLEHVPCPEEFMRQAACLLNPGGIAVIQTPIDRYDYQPPLGKDVPVVFDDTEHLFILVDRAMQELGARTGLQVVSLNEKPWHIGHELCVYKKPDGRMQ